MHSRKDIVRAFLEGRAKGQTGPTHTRGSAALSTDGERLYVAGSVIATKTTGGLVYFPDFNGALSPIWRMVRELSPVPPIHLLFRPNTNITGDNELIFSSAMSALSIDVASFRFRTGPFYPRFSKAINLAIAIAQFVDDYMVGRTCAYISHRLPAIVTYNAFPEQGDPNRVFWCGDPGDADLARRKYSIYLERMGVTEREPR